MSATETILTVILVSLKGFLIVGICFTAGVLICWGIKIAICKAIKAVKRWRRK